MINTVTLEEAIELLAAKAGKGKAKGKGSAKPRPPASKTKAATRKKAA
jgi:topoisomerase IA-like protein